MEGFRVDESPMIAEYRRQLAATLAWCEPRFDPARAADSLRSTELGPPRNIVHERTHVDLIAAEVAAVLGRVEDEVGPVDVLVANAGYGHEGVLEERGGGALG